MTYTMLHMQLEVKAKGEGNLQVLEEKRKRVGKSQGGGKSSNIAQLFAPQPSAKSIAPNGLPTSQQSAAIVRISYSIISFDFEIIM
jgi:hypothetical protein